MLGQAAASAARDEDGRQIVVARIVIIAAGGPAVAGLFSRLLDGQAVTLVGKVLQRARREGIRQSSVRMGPPGGVVERNEP
jgi:hypothetical protein